MIEGMLARMPAFAMMVIVVGVNTNKVRRGIRKIGAGVLACFFTAACTTGYASVRDSVGGFPNESIRISAPPSFAIVDHGFRHDLNASYYSMLDVIGPEPADYDYHYSALPEVSGMTIGENGILEFLPALSQSGDNYSVDVEVSAIREGEVVFRDKLSFQTRVVPAPPQLIVSGLSGQAFGTFGNARTKYGFSLDIPLADGEWEFFRLSLIDPPAGVFLARQHGRPVLGYPSTEFGEGITKVPLRVRYEMETLSGVVFDEIEFVQELLPEPPPTGILDLWNRVGSGAGAFFGFALDSDEEWLAAGEPFIGDSDSDAPFGMVHLWRVEPGTGQIYSEVSLTASVGSG
ncbi:MAG: hypothetical protein R6U56_02160, partial [Opitutales bacterium]